MFDYQQASEVRDAFEKYGVRYLFLGKSGAVLLGFPDTTQDVDVFVEKSLANGQNLVLALLELGFCGTLTAPLLCRVSTQPALASRDEVQAVARWLACRAGEPASPETSFMTEALT